MSQVSDKIHSAPHNMNVGITVGDWKLVTVISQQGNQSQTFQASSIREQGVTGLLKVTNTHYDEIINENDTYITLNKRLPAEDRLKFPRLLERVSRVELDGVVYLYIVLEWITGKVLDTYLMLRSTHLSTIELAFHMSRVLDLLDILHNYDIIHNDLHLGNVMIRDGLDIHTLIDFGWSWSTQNTEEKNWDVTKTMMMFKWYMSFDQLEIWNAALDRTRSTNGIFRYRQAVNFLLKNTNVFT